MSDVTMKRFSPLALLGLAACGDETTSISSGTALKGPLSGALAFVDVNGNRTHESATEASVTTDANGNYSLDNPNGHAIVIQTNSNTIDKSSGASVDGLTLVGRSTDAVVSPFTTIKVDNPDVDLDALAKAMGLEGVDLTSFNPYDLGDNPDATLVAQALEYEQTSHQVVSLLTVAGSALQSKGEASESEALTAVFNALASQLEQAIADDADGLDFLTDAAALEAIVKEAGGQLPEGKTLSESDLDELSANVSGQVAAVNSAIDEVESLEGEVSAFATGTTLADLYDDNAVFAEGLDAVGFAANDAPTAIALSANVIAETIEGAAAPTGVTKIGDLSAIDADADDTVIFTISGADAANFEVIDGGLYLKAGVAANFEVQSAYMITITATDSFGATTTKDLEVKVSNVDEAGDLEVEVGGAPIVGMTLTLDGTAADPDNAVDGGDEGIFEDYTVVWYADDVEVKTEKPTADSEPPSLEITEALVGKEISVQEFYTDKGGFTAEFEKFVFGEVIPDTALLNITVTETASSAMESFANYLEPIGPGVDAMVSVLSDKLNEFEVGVTAFQSNGGNTVTEVSSSGIEVKNGDYRISIEFADFNLTTLEQLQTALDGFDIEDSSTWTIEGGFSEVAFYGPSNNKLFEIYYNENGWGPVDEKTDVLAIKVEGIEDGSIDWIGLHGPVDNQLSSVFEFIGSFANISSDFSALYDQVDAEYIQALSAANTPEEQNQAIDSYWAGIEELEEQEIDASVDAFREASEVYDIDGFFVGAQWNVEASVNINRISRDDGETNVMTLGSSDQAFAIWGDFPVDAVDTVLLIDYLRYPSNFEQSYEAVMTDLAEFGFGGIEGFGLYDSDREPYFKVEIDDFEAVTQEDITIDLEGDIEYEYTTDDGVQSVIYDDLGQYQITGDGIDLDTLYGILEVDEVAVA